MEENNSQIKCPACGGPLTFIHESQMWTCGQCQQEFSDNDILRKQSISPKHFDAKYQIYKCGKCENHMIATRDIDMAPCPVCGGQLTLTDINPCSWNPTQIIPACISQREASEKLKSVLCASRLSTSYYNEKDAQNIELIYIPIHKVSGSTACVAIDGSSNNVVEVSDMPICQCTKILSEDMMRMIEPIDWSQAMEYNPGLLEYTMAAICTNYPKSLSAPTKDRLTAASAIKNLTKPIKLEFSPITLMPVWLYRTTKGRDTIRLAINGHNGEMRYTPDISKEKSKWLVVIVAIILLVVAELITLIYYLNGNLL